MTAMSGKEMMWSCKSCPMTHLGQLVEAIRDALDPEDDGSDTYAVPMRWSPTRLRLDSPAGGMTKGTRHVRSVPESHHLTTTLL